MDRRLKLQTLLESIKGVSKVYFQPPETVKMSYPCIVYSLDADKGLHANNGLYFLRKRYMLTVIDKNPDSVIPDAVRGLPYCDFERSYKKDNLNHWVFTIYF